jgi:hypothetical protein
VQALDDQLFFLLFPHSRALSPKNSAKKGPENPAVTVNPQRTPYKSLDEIRIDLETIPWLLFYDWGGMDRVWAVIDEMRALP